MMYETRFYLGVVLSGKDKWGGDLSAVRLPALSIDNHVI